MRPFGIIAALSVRVLARSLSGVECPEIGQVLGVVFRHVSCTSSVPDSCAAGEFCVSTATFVPLAQECGSAAMGRKPAAGFATQFLSQFSTGPWSTRSSRRAP
jgi:hypothetical protein